MLFLLTSLLTKFYDVNIYRWNLFGSTFTWYHCTICFSIFKKQNLGFFLDFDLWHSWELNEQCHLFSVSTLRKGKKPIDVFCVIDASALKLLFWNYYSLSLGADGYGIATYKNHLWSKFRKVRRIDSVNGLNIKECMRSNIKWLPKRWPLIGF